jgi:hypothetical protein
MTTKAEQIQEKPVMAPNDKDLDNPLPGQFNSTQLNVVTTLDVANTVASKSIDGRAFLMDNSPHSKGKGTPQLQTICKQGQVLNWLIYCLDMDQRADKTWPPMARIVNIVFLDEGGEEVLGTQVCSDLKIYGGPDEIRSPYTPSYYYWAGMVRPDLVPGIYKYRLVYELDADGGGMKHYFQLSEPSLRVLPYDFVPQHPHKD